MHDLIAALEHGRDVELAACRLRSTRHPAGLGERLRGTEQRLGGHACVVGAFAADEVALDEHDRHPRFGEASSAHLAGRPGAEHDHIAFPSINHDRILPLTDLAAHPPLAGLAAAKESASLAQIMAQPLSGQLLLASPTLTDPNFTRTVVLIGMHSDEGAVGVVLNRPSTVTIGEAVPLLDEDPDAREPVFVGGPVQPTSIVYLAEFMDPATAGLLVLGRIGFPGPDIGLQELSQSTERRRLFVGFAGWGPGQLDDEIADGDWIEQMALPEDVFTETPEDLWSRVLTRKGGSYALIARMPIDPSVN
jgi:putative transcriptional regulator